MQAGGNLGVFAEHLAPLFDAVYTFEPDPVLFSHLCHNVSDPNVIKLQAALGDTHVRMGTSPKRRDGKPATHEGVTHVVPGAGIIPQLRIDDFELRYCDLIYLDVEGWELLAIKGALETMRRCRPVVGIEINRNLDLAGFRPDDLRTLIATAGYRLAATMRSDEIWVPL